MPDQPADDASTTADTADTWVAAQPDRMPTADEERATERGAAHVDLGAVSEHYEEMADRGANVEGEGQIELEAD